MHAAQNKPQKLKKNLLRLGVADRSRDGTWSSFAINGQFCSALPRDAGEAQGILETEWWCKNNGHNQVLPLQVQAGAPGIWMNLFPDAMPFLNNFHYAFQICIWI